MKKRYGILRKIVIIFIAIAVLLSIANIYEATRPTTVRAVGDLGVDWGVPDGQPIFVVTNMAPADKETRSVVVKNNGDSIRPVGVRGAKTDEIGDLSSVLDFIISKNGTSLYGGSSPTGPKTLSQFITDSADLNGVFLLNLNPGAQTTLKFEVTFNQSSGNEFQNKSVTFDLIIGISVEVPSECQGIEFSGGPIFGTSKGDRLVGTAGNDLIFGFEGGDSINGGGGDDCIVGVDGGDSLKGGNGNDVILGQGGSDSLKGGDGNDKLYGGEGSDDLKGEDGNDQLLGSSGSDSLKGGLGDDFLDGGGGSDALKGENGIDTCLNGESVKSCEIY
ncbi:MAG: hypothetical protein A2Y57_00650 [Candidatus Woykebacteria bacterium RBG_13_40_7b]|uniref:Uncharacterized protein n=1 Tax=Candidatus Woykebacteria bacterium RBG_13_40_7b TaxID=1802594 RepID=A0A1G1W8H0_9BACT|nr:MAG: hypothetical protein A2Y57_00650 [Candidatus Woykebacteria bacterium RBG_13_40_7b]